MGLCNSPASFQRAMQLVLRGLTWEEVVVYLDDIIILGTDFDNTLAIAPRDSVSGFLSKMFVLIAGTV